jgi:outer membrane protein
MKRFCLPAVALGLLAQPAHGQPGRVLTLDEALRTARAHHPQLQVAHAQTEVAHARAEESLAPLLPQVSGSATYQRTTSNYVPQPGSAGASSPAAANFDTFNSFRFGLSANQLIYDFGQSTGKWDAAKINARSQANSEQRSGEQVAFNLRAAYYNAAATRSLVKVAQDALVNQEAHLKQSQGFVRAGTRPEIDLAQALTNRATARVALINAQNGYDVARAQLNQAMGVEGTIEYDVDVPVVAPVPGEDGSTDELLPQAIKARPDLQALADQIRAQQATIRATKGGYGPALNAGTAFNESGPALDNLGWNWYLGLSLTWQIFGGGITRQQVREAQASASVLSGQYEIQHQQIRLELEQARLAVRAAKASVEATHEAVVNAREQLRLAEGRYQAGVGNVIELGDSQVAMTTASAQEVQAQFNLATARAQLMLALGQD